MTTIEVDGVRLARVSGSGEDGPVSKEELQVAKDEARDVSKGAALVVRERRERAEATRFCVWEGQSADGRKHQEAQDGRPAFPFEGASDARIRLADQITNERVLVLVAAALRNLPRVRGLDIRNEGLGQKLTTLLRWVIRNQLGAEYLRELTKCAQYREGDSPGAGIMGIWWDRQEGLERVTITLQQLVQVLMEMGIDARTLNQLEVQLMNPERDGETAEAVQQLLGENTKHQTPSSREYPNSNNQTEGPDFVLSTASARRVVKDLRESGRADFARRYVKQEGPCLRAYRCFDDVWFPTNTTRVEDARVFYVVEWLTEVQLWQRVASDGYAESFVEEVLEHEGQSGWRWDQGRHNLVAVDTGAPGDRLFPEERRGKYEVVTIWYQAVNEDHVPGIYYFPFHFSVEEAAHDRRLCDYAHGQYPLVFFGRETLTDRLVDSRGVPELVATEQYGMKLLADSFADHVSLATVPPIKVPARRSKVSLVIGPLKLIKEQRPGEIEYMKSPEYPVGNEKERLEIRRRVDEYWGRVSEEIPGVLAQLHQQGMVQNFLADLGAALTQALQLCQQYLSEETLAMITGEDGIPIARSREEIQGKFAVELSFDPRDLDMTYLKELVGLIVQVLQIDTLGTVERDKLVQRLFMAVQPELAAGTLRPVDAANESEVKDEKNNLSLIANGLEPEMVAEGLNFPLRLQTVQQAVQLNPEYVQKLSPMSKKIFEARVKYLQNQVQQERNAQIGRQVGQPALGQGGTEQQAGSGQPAGISGAAGA